jgi:hypothetical protein
MKRIITYATGFLLLLFTLSCSTEEEIPKPENLIPEGQMANILKDICKIEARFQRRLSIKSTTNSELVYHNYNVIFEEHNVSLTDFKNSYEYYGKTPDKMGVIYDSAIVILTKEQSILEVQEKAKKKK